MDSQIRSRIRMTDSEIESRFEWYGYRVSVAKHICFTTETVEAFREARESWFKAGRLIEDEPGLLFVKEAQPKPMRATRDVVVIDFGTARAVLGSDCKHDASKPVHRCAEALA